MNMHNSERKTAHYHRPKVFPEFRLIEPLDENLIETLKADPATPKGKIIDLIKEHIFRRSKKCSLCGNRCNRRDLGIGRRKPISHGGKDNIENLQLLCFSCSELKGNSTMLQIRKKLWVQKIKK
ncbi:MAG: HNH endonuclease signature motif containing protein [Candidatus Altiarchaeota archaeon]